MKAKKGAKDVADRCLVRAPRRGFRLGWNSILDAGKSVDDPAKTKLSFSILQLRKGARHRASLTKECVAVLLAGDVVFTAGNEVQHASRRSLFEEGPSTFHFGRGSDVSFQAGPFGAQLAWLETENRRPLPTRFTPAAEVQSEDRGAGLVQGACRRCVRTIFDYSSRPDSNLVVGEVVNYPGRWSSYPPHHHPQPEIYHYRFTAPQGYGHAELGDRVVRVEEGDTVVIPGGLDHAQVSAPGYGMYYLWVVRHLPRRPYKGFKFSPSHTWLLDGKNQGWLPPIGTLT